jgi:hypothetical protein
MPLTKEDLRNYHIDYEAEILEKLRDSVLGQIVAEVKEKAYMTCLGIKKEDEKPTTYLYSKSRIRNHSYFHKILRSSLEGIFRTLLPSILEELKKEFPDSEVRSSEDGSCIIVDWS